MTLRKETKVYMVPNSARSIGWHAELTARQAIINAGYAVNEVEGDKKVVYTITIDGSVTLQLDDFVPEPGATSVNLMMVTKEIKGNA